MSELVEGKQHRSREIGEHEMEPGSALPMGDRVLVVRDRLRERTSGGIVLPDEVRERSRPATGVVVAVGPEVEGVVPGDVVAFGEYMGTTMWSPLGGGEVDEYRSLRSDELMCKWPGPGALLDPPYEVV